MPAANAAYTETFGDKASLSLPPARSFAILTCMDARLDSAKYAGLAEGDATRSLVVSYKLLGTEEWFIIHHSHCGKEFFDDAVMRGLLASSLETAHLGADGFTDIGAGPGYRERCPASERCPAGPVSPAGAEVPDATAAGKAG